MRLTRRKLSEPTSSSLGTSVSSSNHRLGDLPHKSLPRHFMSHALLHQGCGRRQVPCVKLLLVSMASLCRADYSPIQFVCLSFRALRGPGVLVSSILVAVWLCAVLETSCRCDLQQVLEGSSPGSSRYLRLRPQWPVAGRLGMVFPCRFPARGLSPASKEHSMSDHSSPFPQIHLSP